MIKKMAGVKVIEEKNVAETIAVQKTMESMIELDAASLVFPARFGYSEPHMLAMARKYPKVEFRHCGGLWNKDKHPKNTNSHCSTRPRAQRHAGRAFHRPLGETPCLRHS